VQDELLRGGDLAIRSVVSPENLSAPHRASYYARTGCERRGQRLRLRRTDAHGCA